MTYLEAEKAMVDGKVVSRESKPEYSYFMLKPDNYTLPFKKKINDIYTKNNIIVKIVNDVHEVLHYTNLLGSDLLATDWYVVDTK